MLRGLAALVLLTGCAKDAPRAPTPVVVAEVVDAGQTDRGDAGVELAPSVDAAPTQMETGETGETGDASLDPLGPYVQADPPKTSGPLAPAVIQPIVQSHISKVNACYIATLKTYPAFGGPVSVRFVIETSGKVTTATVDGAPDDLAACMAAVFRSMRFPKPQGGSVTVTYPLTLQGAVHPRN